MKLKNIKARDLIINLLVAFAYPLARAIKSENHMLAFSDACTYIGLALLIIGLINTFFLHGDFDITGYIASNAMNKEKKDFSIYMEEQETKRKESFNYPLFSSIILFAAAYISSLLC